MNPPATIPQIEHALTHAVTMYDSKQSTKRGYNIHALPQYLERVEAVTNDIKAGADVRRAVVAGFSGTLLNAVLRGLKMEKFTDAELERQNRSWAYTPEKISA